MSVSSTANTWRAFRLKQLVHRFHGGGTPDSGNADHYTTPGNGYPWLMISDMSRGSIVTSSRKCVTEGGLRSKNLQILPKGTVVYAMYASVGKVAQLAIPAAINQALIGISTHPDRLIPRFLVYALESKRVEVIQEASASTQPNLSAQKVKNLQISVPSIEIQTLIVRYLDHAELRIAKAIAGKNLLLQLLEEKRNVAVEDIVLGRNVGHTMSDADSSWIGQMPSHWEVVPLRSLLCPRKNVVGNRHSNYALLSLTLGGVILRDLSEMKGKFPASFDTYQEVREGDFVMCLFDVEETPRTIGLSALKGMITGAYDVFECLDLSARDYLYEFLLTVDREKRLQPLYRGLRKTIPRASLLSIGVPLPPTNEREEIVTRVRVASSQLNSAVQSLRKEIDLLKEYRTRLISDVATGKIDICEEAAKLPDIEPAELAAVLASGAAVADEEDMHGDD